MFQRRLLPAEREWRLVVNATQQVGRHAAERRLQLAIELLPFEFAFIQTLDDMERFLDDVGLDNVKATVDISHFWLMRIPPADLAKRLKGRVAHVHVSDCDGTNHGDMPPGRGNTPFLDYMAAIHETGFAGTASIELEFPPDPKAMSAWVAEAHDKTLQLLKQAFPGVGRIAVLANPKDAISISEMPKAEMAAGQIGARLLPFEASAPAELRALAPSALSGSDCLLVMPGGMFWNNRATIIDLASKARVPAIYPEREYADGMPRFLLET